MKTFLLRLSILFCATALPAFGELTVQDLEKIRQIVKESETDLTARIEKSETDLTARIETVASKVDAINTRLRIVETGVAELRGRSLGFGVLRDWIVTHRARDRQGAIPPASLSVTGNRARQLR